ncbi:MAG: DsrE family protein [Pyrobaculum sp.]
MKIGVILKSGDPVSLYVAGTYIATELARGSEVSVFATGEAVLALANRAAEGGPAVEAMRRLKVYWRDLLKTAKPLGLRVYVCETALKIYGVKEGELDRELVDAVTSMFTFLEEVNNIVVF